MPIRDRLPRLINLWQQQLPALREAYGRGEAVSHGSASNLLAGAIRFIAVGTYALNANVSEFRSGMREAASIRGELPARFDAGEAISASFVSMRVYTVLLDSWASGDEALSVEIADRMGGRDELEAEYDRPFDIAFGKALKCLTLSDMDSFRAQVDVLEALCESRGNRDFRGYATGFRAFDRRDLEMSKAAFSEIAAGHARQSNGRGLFKDTEDEVLSVWGLAVANLFRARGFAVCPDSELIPVALYS